MCLYEKGGFFSFYYYIIPSFALTAICLFVGRPGVCLVTMNKVFYLNGTPRISKTVQQIIWEWQGRIYDACSLYFYFLSYVNLLGCTAIFCRKAIVSQLLDWKHYARNALAEAIVLQSWSYVKIGSRSSALRFYDTASKSPTRFKL